MSETIPDVMRAIEIAAPGGPEQLRLATRPVPTPQAGEVLVRVAAAGVNRPDILQRMGVYPPPPGASDIPGLEIAGTVVRAGAGASQADRWPWPVRAGGHQRRAQRGDRL